MWTCIAFFAVLIQICNRFDRVECAKPFNYTTDFCSFKFNTRTNLDFRLAPSRTWQPEFGRRIGAMLRNVEWSEGSAIEIRVRHCSDTSVAFLAQTVSLIQLNLWLQCHVGD